MNKYIFTRTKYAARRNINFNKGGPLNFQQSLTEYSLIS